MYVTKEQIIEAVLQHKRVLRVDYLAFMYNMRTKEIVTDYIDRDNENKAMVLSTLKTYDELQKNIDMLNEYDVTDPETGKKKTFHTIRFFGIKD